MKMIKTQDVTKQYHLQKIITDVLKGITISIDAGEFVSIIGPSGSGKTTLLYVLSGLEKKTTGSVQLFGKEIDAYHDRDLSRLRQTKLGFVFQFYNLIPNLTVYENVQLACVLSHNKQIKKIDEVLSYVGLSEYKRHFPSQLSGGMQQRVAIARCLVNEPDVIFADEPTGNLDYNNSIAMMTLFQQLNKELGTTVVMVTHNEEMVQYGTRCIKLMDGVVISDEPVVQ